MRVIHSPKEMGARGKFLMTANTPGYHIIVDDDILYPYDYVWTMISHVEYFKRQAIVGAHGKLFMYRKPPHPMTFINYNFADKIASYYPVHMLGTGTIAYHSSLITIDARSLAPGKIDDQVALLCQKFCIPCLVVPHNAQWMQDLTDISVLDALRRNIPLREEATQRIVNHASWKLFAIDDPNAPVD